MERNERERAIVCLKRLIGQSNHCLVDFAQDALYMAIAALSDTWVKCSDRLPTVEDADKDGYVNVWYEGIKCCDACHWRDVEILDVTHWMTPVPGPLEV